MFEKIGSSSQFERAKSVFLGAVVLAASRGGLVIQVRFVLQESIKSISSISSIRSIRSISAT